jgi:agmatinase
MPRFAGVRTFMRAPHTTDLAGVDAAVYGIPFDTATTYRTGTRFGPEAIRSPRFRFGPTTRRWT